MEAGALPVLAGVANTFSWCCQHVLAADPNFRTSIKREHILPGTHKAAGKKGAAVAEKDAAKAVAHRIKTTGSRDQRGPPEKPKSRQADGRRDEGAGEDEADGLSQLRGRKGGERLVLPPNACLGMTSRARHLPKSVVRGSAAPWARVECIGRSALGGSVSAAGRRTISPPRSSRPSSVGGAPPRPQGAKSPDSPFGRRRAAYRRDSHAEAETFTC